MDMPGIFVHLCDLYRPWSRLSAVLGSACTTSSYARPTVYLLEILSRESRRRWRAATPPQCWAPRRECRESSLHRRAKLRLIGKLRALGAPSGCYRYRWSIAFAPLSEFRELDGDLRELLWMMQEASKDRAWHAVTGATLQVLVRQAY